MSDAKRAYNIVRGFVSREWDRIKEVERNLAQNELEEALREPAPAKKPAPRRTVSEELDHEVDRVGIARKMLGVDEKASFQAIRRAFEKLNKRSDPKNFPDGTGEQLQAEQIQKRAYWAYNVLTEHFDAIEKRFKSLEIE